MIQVDDYQQLQHQIDDLLQDKAKRQLLGERAEIFMQQNSDILDRYISDIKTYYQPPDE